MSKTTPDELFRGRPAADPARIPATAPAAADGYLSSGQSPGDDDAPRLHLVGPGQVGCAFLRQLATRPAAQRPLLVAASDSTATVFARQGLDAAALAEHKRTGGHFADLAGAEAVSTELAIRLVAADVVVDATPSDAAGRDAAVRRAQAALQSGAAVVLASKNGLAHKAGSWLRPATRARFGVHAVLGGTGAELLHDLDELRRDCRGLALVGNVTTTAIVTAIENGASLAEGIAAAERLGYLEPGGTLDLDGSDAVTKLLCVFGAVFGESFTNPPAFAAVVREDVRDLDVELLRERARRGATTRLVARADRAGAALAVRYEELPVGSPLAVPQDRVVYGYELPSGLRVHTGLGVGYERTAAALWVDVERLCDGSEVLR